jgi:hypothetical protein
MDDAQYRRRKRFRRSHQERHHQLPVRHPAAGCRTSTGVDKCAMERLLLLADFCDHAERTVFNAASTPGFARRVQD